MTTYIVTTENPLNEVAAPNLPLATTLYSQQYQDQLNNVLRLYFNRLDSILKQLMTSSSTPLSVGTYTSKGRLEVSNPQTIFFNTFQYGLETDVWDTSTTSGGTATFDSTRAAVNMSVTSTVGSKVIRQTLNTQRYIPSRSSELCFAMLIGATVAGIRKRLGFYDGVNGFYFEDNGGTLSFNLTSNVTGSTVVTSVSQSSWNGDKLDGTGTSGLTLNLSDIQLFCFDYEWYGAGLVSLSFIINGQKIICHTFYSANNTTVPWCKTPFLPIRIEMENISAAAGATMYQGSNSLISEGSTDKLGIGQNLISPITGTALTTANTYYPILSIRLKSTQLQGIVLPSYFQAGTLDNVNIFFKLTRNATLTGASWTNMPDANSFCQYDTSATAVTGGSDLFSGYIPATSSGNINELNPDTVYQLGRSALGTVSDTLTLSIAATTANKNGVGSLTWIEQR